VIKQRSDGTASDACKAREKKFQKKYSRIEFIKRASRWGAVAPEVFTLAMSSCQIGQTGEFCTIIALVASGPPPDANFFLRPELCASSVQNAAVIAFGGKD
jgi:hypothetical protein